RRSRCGGVIPATLLIYLPADARLTTRSPAANRFPGGRLKKPMPTTNFMSSNRIGALLENGDLGLLQKHSFYLFVLHKATYMPVPKWHFSNHNYLFYK